MDRATAKGELEVKEATAQGESALVKDDQVKSSPSKLDVLVSTIEVFSLEVVASLNDTPHIESIAIEKEVVTQDKNLKIFYAIPVVERKG